MIPLPNLDAYTYSDGEEFIIAMLLQGQNIDDITSRIDGTVFYNPALAGIYSVCFDYVVTTGRGHVDFLAVYDLITRMGKSAEILQYLTYLRQLDLRMAPALDYMVEYLHEAANRRKLIITSHQTMLQALNVSKPVHTIIKDVEESLLNIEQGNRQKLEVILPKDILQRREEGLMKRIATRKVVTGWDGFDRLLSHGFARKKMSVIAGRTSMGKSFFKTNLMRQLLRNQHGVLNICPEQGFDSEHDRLDAVVGGIPLRTLTNIQSVPAGDPLFQQLKAISTQMSTDWQYACVPTRSITVAGVRASIRRCKRAGIHPEVVFIDLFDRLDDVNAVANRTANISRKLVEIEQIADEEDVHMCLLVQVNRGTEGRKDHRPTVADLRDCGNFEQDADLIFLLYREGYYNRDLEDNILDVEIAKQRDGRAGVVFQFLITSKETLAITPMGEKRFIETPEGSK